MEPTSRQTSSATTKPQNGSSSYGLTQETQVQKFEDNHSHQYTQISQINQGRQDQNVPSQYAHIKGWGADLDKSNRPGYPMERTPPRLTNVHWHEPEQQEQTVEVLQSIERPKMASVFGTTLPPTGLSGKLRRAAFKFSESDLRHWLVLLVADRVDMVEGIGADLKKGHIPNVFSEMGLKSEFKYNRPALIKKTVIASTVVGLGVYLLMSRRNSRKN